MTNPLLKSHELPPFSTIKPEHVESAVDQLIVENKQAIDALVKQGSAVSWESVNTSLENISDRLNKAWSPVSHMNSVVNSPELREAYNNCLPKLAEYGTWIGQHQGLFKTYQALADSEEFKTLDVAQQKVITNALRDFRLSGIALEGEAKQRYGELKKQLSEKTSKFSDNVLDATHHWEKHITDKSELAGLPESALEVAQAAAQAKELTGYLLTLEFPSYLPVMTYCENRQLRQEMYTAFCTKASGQGPNAGKWDNSSLIDDILTLRHELAQLLGFNNYAELSLATKMAESPEEVMGFLNQLAEKTYPVAKQEFAELTEFAKQLDGIEQLEAWDVAYYAEKLKHSRYDISQEQLRPYFPAEKVVSGMFKVVHQLFGIEIVEVEGVDSWHKDVKFFNVTRDNKVVGKFFLDLYSRSKKRSGAWMDECQVRRKIGDKVQTPIAYLVCNFTPPVGDKPALLTHDEVTTLFHEFGHGLHHMLTQVDYMDVSGINGVPWDAVELPSQFLENWCWEKEALMLISGHYQTGEVLPDEMLDKLLTAKNFQSGMMMVRQLEFALFDFKLHLEHQPGMDVQKVLNEVRQQVAVVPAPEFNRFQNSFSHIFAGGYAAGYYSYKWAEVLSADAFSKFEEHGIFDQITGQQFLTTILEKGGSEDAMKLFVDFRGHKPSIEPLLKHSGITQ